MTDTYEPRLYKKYHEKIRAKMKEQFGYTNEMQIPRITKVVLNMGRMWLYHGFVTSAV